MSNFKMNLSICSTFVQRMDTRSCHHDQTRLVCTMRTVIYTWSIDRSSIVRRREREREGEGQVRQKGQDTIKPSLHARAPEPFRELARNYRPGTVLAC